jgi:hypothetical protein
MIPELIAQLRTRAKEAKKAMKAKFMAVRYHIMKPLRSACRPAPVLIVPSGSGNALDVGKRYRRTSGHSPIFSLFTFFGDRQ